MDLTLQSPVSPITPNSRTASTASNTSIRAPATTLAQSSQIQKAGWRPATFRFYFLLLPTAMSLTLGIAILVLVIYSQRHHGIGADNGSSAILFGWRFTPTLLAVLYTQLTVILFEDAKRTEPFARLAKAPVEGASAYGTVLQTQSGWWSVFIGVLFKRKSIGKTSWCLICSALINVLALLAISPLSSALLTSEEVVVAKSLEFSRIVPKINTQLPVSANGETYFRTMAALMRNISTSAWITDTSLTLPIWPNSERVQLGPNLVSNYSSWAAETTTLYTNFSCQEMKLESANLTPMPYVAYDVLGHGPYNGTEPMVSFVLTSVDGCRYELSNHPSVELAYNGGLTWSNSSTYFLLRNDVLSIGRLQIAPTVSSTSPYARLQTSQECGDRDIILLSTPWTTPFSQDWSQGPGLQLNKTYERSPQFQMKGLICGSQYSMAKQNITTAMSFGTQPILNYSADGHVDRVPVTDALVDIPKFQAMTLQNQWSDYFDETSMYTDADSASGGYIGAGTDQSVRQAVPGFSGLGPFLGALYSFNVTSMMGDQQFVGLAGRVKGRFFAECLREALTDPEAVETNIIEGETTVNEERIVVLREIGIALAVLFLASFLLLVVVYCSSRLRWRPLNLQTDPSSTVGQGMLLRSQLARRSTFRNMHLAPRPDFHDALRSDTFYTLNGALHTGSGGNQPSAAMPANSKQYKHCWRPRVIRLWMLFALGCFLTVVLVAVLLMNAFSAHSRLSAPAFIYEADLSKLGLGLSTFAPISIAPTLISIAIGLWWDQLDMTFRILQPYIAMSQQPTPICNGAGLTYRSRTWVGAAVKAARNRHWVLFMIALSSVFCQILTVSMSALFEGRAANVTRLLKLNRSLEMRQIPVITEIGSKIEDLSIPDPKLYPYEILDTLLLDQSKNWLPGAAIQLSLNGTELAWTRDGWSFVPLDLAHVSGSTSLQPNASRDSKETSMGPVNVTVSTSAVRARLECNPIPEVANVSAWLTHPDENLFPGNEQYNLTGFEDYYIFNHTMFDGGPSNTSVFADWNMIRCCSNGTSDDPQRAAIGYWSPTDAPDSPYADSQWPFPFVTKWIVGKPRTIMESASEISDSAPGQILLFEEVPSLQAARCMPVIEIANSTVLLDKDTGVIHSYKLAGPVSPAEAAWSDVFDQHGLSNSSQQYTTNYTGPLNMTTSYGILFMGSMFRAADPDINLGLTVNWEPLDENAFVIRDNEYGLNMDLMTYSMYSLANKDPNALLDYTTLVEHASHVFQTFFQHFVNNGLSLTEGGLAYQKINDASLEALGPSIAANGSVLPQRKYASLNTNGTVDAWVSHRIQVLHMNTVATYLTAALLIWLIGTTAIVTCLQRKYTNSMIRDVQLIADGLVLVAGSDNFLRLVHDKGYELKKVREVKTKLGWFKDSNGEARWGVEVVGGRDSVEWVDAPKQGWHVQEKKSRSGRLFSWKKG